MKRVCLNISPLWVVVLGYLLVTSVLVSVYEPAYFVSFDFLSIRLFVVCYLVALYWLKKRRPTFNPDFSDALTVYALLGSFYTDTAHLTTLVFPKVDSLLSQWDEMLFGNQPSLVFSEHFSHPVFSEAMFLGYFSYYLMPLLAFAIIWRTKKADFKRFSTLVLSSFFIYYLIFVFLPAEGPQYFFASPLNRIEGQGVFAYLVKLMQHLGEAPTAAFPSSHVGISIILLTLLYPLNRKLFLLYIPFVSLLCFATVYIKAHYAVDVVAGLISAPVILYAVKQIYSRLSALSQAKSDDH